MPTAPLQLHSFLAANVLKKPLIIEEFGLTWFKKTLDQQRVLFKVRCAIRQTGAATACCRLHTEQAAHTRVQNMGPWVRSCTARLAAACLHCLAVAAAAVLHHAMLIGSCWTQHTTRQLPCS